MNPVLKVSGIPCRLTTTAARRALRDVLAQIRRRCPEDHKHIQRVVREVRPIASESWDESTLGQWVEDNPVHDDPKTWGYGADEDETPGVVLLYEFQSPYQLRAILAHELGHACTTNEDLRYSNIPDSEWASELTADRYAYKWGFGRLIGRTRKGRCVGHHALGPGKCLTVENEYGEVSYRVTRNLRFRIVSAAAAKKPAPKKPKK